VKARKLESLQQRRGDFSPAGGENSLARGSTGGGCKPVWLYGLSRICHPPQSFQARQGHDCCDNATTLCPRKLFIPSLAALYRFDPSCSSDTFSVDSRFSAGLRYLHQIPAHHRAAQTTLIHVCDLTNSVWCDGVLCGRWREERKRPHASQKRTGKKEGLAAVPWKSDAASPHDHKEQSVWRL